MNCIFIDVIAGNNGQFSKHWNIEPVEMEGKKIQLLR